MLSALEQRECLGGVCGHCGRPGDVPSPTDRRVRRSNHFTVAKKADSLYKCVSAASIAAKVKRARALTSHGATLQVRRDKVLREWASNHDMTGDADFGSGYPSDERTKQWLTRHLHPLFGYSELVRFSWSTTKGLLKSDGVPCHWYVCCVLVASGAFLSLADRGHAGCARTRKTKLPTRSKSHSSSAQPQRRTAQRRPRAQLVQSVEEQTTSTSAGCRLCTPSSCKQLAGEMSLWWWGVCFRWMNLHVLLPTSLFQLLAYMVHQRKMDLSALMSRLQTSRHAYRSEHRTPKRCRPPGVRMSGQPKRTCRSDHASDDVTAVDLERLAQL